MALAYEITFPSPDTLADMSTGSNFFIGTATVLIPYAVFTGLTNPNFIYMHEKVDLGYGLSATCQTHPALDIHELFLAFFQLPAAPIKNITQGGRSVGHHFVLLHGLGHQVLFVVFCLVVLYRVVHSLLPGGFLSQPASQG